MANELKEIVELLDDHLGKFQVVEATQCNGVWRLMVLSKETAERREQTAQREVAENANR